MIHTSRKILHICLGVLLLILGVAGLVLPIVNGTILLMVGLILISFESPYVEKHFLTLTQKSKFIHGIHLKLEKILRKFFRK